MATISMPEQDIPALVAPLVNGEADIVIGDRNVAALQHLSWTPKTAAGAGQLGRQAGVEHARAGYDERIPRIYARGGSPDEHRL